MSSPAPSEEELRELRRRMLASANRHLNFPDAEDATQEALLRVVKDRRPSAVPLSQRAFRKLKDTRAELFRSKQHKFDVAAAPLSEAEEADVDEAENIAGLLALEQQVIEIGGRDVLTYAMAKAEGLTNAEMVNELGWSPQRVDAARKKLSRKSPALANLMKQSRP
jgi:DNA-directed RNA polymerase specialized sigma24 family protein